jgi:TATA-box binding protein (TBP) (component of TFIID and TFIIIB)
MDFRVVNVVVRAQLHSAVATLSLNDFMPFANIKFTNRPTMAKFYHEGLTIVIFNGLKCRSMGLPTKCLNDLDLIIARHKEILFDLIMKFPWPWEMQDVTFSTATVTHQIPFTVSLHAVYLMFEPELFSGAKLRVNDSAHVNVFGTGKVVCLGVKSKEHVQQLLSFLYECIHK